MRKAEEFAALIMQELRETEIRDPDSMEEVIEKHVKEAMEHALWCYAWMKDGVSYVGSGITTLNAAKEEL